jgi:hypothetical protein
MICGLLACAHASVLTTLEAAHPYKRETRPRIEAAALPPESDHTHRDFDRFIRLEATALVSGTSSEAIPPGQFLTTQPYRPRYRHPDASLYLGTPVVLRST